MNPKKSKKECPVGKQKTKPLDKLGAPAKPKQKVDKTLRDATKTVTQKRGTFSSSTNVLTLTDELAQHIAVMWVHNLTDEVIYSSLGIPPRTFKDWLDRNHTVSINTRLGDTIRRVTTGFRELKTQMKAFFEPGYLMRLGSVIDKAEDKEDFRTASSNLRWLIAKRLPKKYGREADARIGIEQIEAITNSIFQIIFKHVKDPDILGAIQDDLDKLKAQEEVKLEESLNAPDPSQIETDGYENEKDLSDDDE